MYSIYNSCSSKSLLFQISHSDTLPIHSTCSLFLRLFLGKCSHFLTCPWWVLNFFFIQRFSEVKTVGLYDQPSKEGLLVVLPALLALFVLLVDIRGHFKTWHIKQISNKEHGSRFQFAQKITLLIYLRGSQSIISV